MPYTNVPKPMWGKMDDCVTRVMKTGKDKPRAIAICHASIVGKKKDVDDMDDNAEDLVKETVSDAEMEALTVKGYVPYGVTSFTSLRQWRTAKESAEEVYDLTSDFVGLVESVMGNPEVTDKSAAIKGLANEFAGMVDNPESSGDDMKSIKEDGLAERIVSKIKGLLFKDEKDREKVTLGEEGLMIWKEASGEYKWLARYSNNFRDDDNPPEIIADKSHRNFVEMVDKGQAPLPELWIWHVPEWKIGQATFVAYDDAGFALAGGLFDKGKEAAAEWLSKQEDVLVSHGMPNDSIVRDADDPSIIVQHRTAEISPLPSWAAANKITGFVVLNKESDMSIPASKRDALIGQWKIDPALLDALEKQNQSDAEKARAEGRQSKEGAETETLVVAQSESTESAETEQASAETSATTEAQTVAAEQQGDTTATVDYPTRQEIADAFGTVLGEMKGQIETLAASVEALSKEMKDWQQAQAAAQSSDEAEKVKQFAENVPAASLAALLAGSIIGRSETRVDGRTSLAQSKPKEAEPAEDEGGIGIPFLNKMLSSK